LPSNASAPFPPSMIFAMPSSRLLDISFRAIPGCGNSYFSRHRWASQRCFLAGAESLQVEPPMFGGCSRFFAGRAILQENRCPLFLITLYAVGIPASAALVAERFHRSALPVRAAERLYGPAVRGCRAQRGRARG
jgi:hypothetical protein